MSDPLVEALLKRAAQEGEHWLQAIFTGVRAQLPVPSPTPVLTLLSPGPARSVSPAPPGPWVSGPPPPLTGAPAAGRSALRARGPEDGAARMPTPEPLCASQLSEALPAAGMQASSRRRRGRAGRRTRRKNVCGPPSEGLEGRASPRTAPPLSPSAAPAAGGVSASSAGRLEASTHSPAAPGTLRSVQGERRSARLPRALERLQVGEGVASPPRSCKRLPAPSGTARSSGKAPPSHFLSPPSHFLSPHISAEHSAGQSSITFPAGTDTPPAGGTLEAGINPTRSPECADRSNSTDQRADFSPGLTSSLPLADAALMPARGYQGSGRRGDSAAEERFVRSHRTEQGAQQSHSGNHCEINAPSTDTFTPPPTAQIPNKNYPLTAAPSNPSNGSEHSYLLTPPLLSSTTGPYTAINPPRNNVRISPITPLSNGGRRRRRQTSSQSSSDNSRRHSRYPSKRPSRHRRRRSSHRSRRRSRASGWLSSATSEGSDVSLSPDRSHRARGKSSKLRAPSRAFSQGEQPPTASSHNNNHTVAENRAINPQLRGCNQAPTHDTQSIGQHIGQSLAVAGARVSPSCDITPSTSAGVPPGSEYTRPESHSGFQNPAAQRATPGYSVSTVPVGHSGQSLMPLIRASVSPATWQVYGVEVWVVGDSYVYWAEERAKLRPGGTNLYLSGIKVNWRGLRGLQWKQVFKEMVGIARMAEHPVIMVVHAGGNDLGKQKVAELYKWVTTDMERFSCLFRNIILVWSDITPRAVWRGARDKKAIERTRVKFNARIGKYVRGRGGVVIRHHPLQGDNTPQLRPDGVHLTDIGLDIFLSDLQDGVEQALTLMGGVGVPRR
ncbi:uncharacterized protein LOC143805642 [Ranitomeya variabilis]|uniref:uncharacterized protein LOC143805642 n=1 Tax=Ranitomeya variabilis TaxID=490064 RepID=UPI0040561682